MAASPDECNILNSCILLRTRDYISSFKGLFGLISCSSRYFNNFPKNALFSWFSLHRMIGWFLKCFPCPKIEGTIVQYYGKEKTDGCKWKKKALPAIISFRGFYSLLDSRGIEVARHTQEPLISLACMLTGLCKEPFLPKRSFKCFKQKRRQII